MGVKCHLHGLSCSPLVFSSSEAAEDCFSACLHGEESRFCDAGLHWRSVKPFHFSHKCFPTYSCWRAAAGIGCWSLFVVFSAVFPKLLFSSSSSVLEQLNWKCLDFWGSAIRACESRFALNSSDCPNIPAEESAGLMRKQWWLGHYCASYLYGVLLCKPVQKTIASF